MTSLPQQTTQQLEDWLKIMLSKYPSDNVYRVMTERVPILAERMLKEMDTRRENREYISQIVVKIDQQRCRNKIVYNKDINAFYSVLPNGQLQQQASDAILLPLIHDIPQEMHMHRFQILRAVKVKLTPSFHSSTGAGAASFFGGPFGSFGPFGTNTPAPCPPPATRSSFVSPPPTPAIVASIRKSGICPLWDSA